jgi:Tfp pilus assembly protein FimT
MDRKSHRICTARGITLIELIFSVSISALLLALGAPSLSHLLDDNRLRAETNRLFTAINLTRSEAVSRNTPVSICPSDTSTPGSPLCGGDYSDGWIVFSNPDRDQVRDHPLEEVFGVYDALPGGFTVSNRKGTQLATETITYLPDGSSRRTRTLLMCASKPGRDLSRSIVMNVIGRPRIASDWGRCPILE